MTKIILLSVLLLTQQLAYAGTNHNEGNSSQSQRATQGQVQAQSQAQAQAQAQAQGLSNSVNTTVTGDKIDIPASSAISSNMSPSAQCMGVATGAVQVPAFGISVGKSYESKPCNQRELVRVLHTLNQDTAAIEVVCSIEGAEITTLCKDLKSNK